MMRYIIQICGKMYSMYIKKCVVVAVFSRCPVSLRQPKRQTLTSKTRLKNPKFMLFFLPS